MAKESPEVSLVLLEITLILALEALSIDLKSPLLPHRFHHLLEL